MKNPSKRSRLKYPELDPLYSTKLRRELLDFDYIHLLDDSQKAYLNKFLREWLSGYFEKTENGNYKHSNLHRKKDQRKECYTRNNARNRCIFGLAKTTGQLIYTNGPEMTNMIECSQSPSTNDLETSMIEYLDSKAEDLKKKVDSSQEKGKKSTDLKNKPSN